MGEIEMIYTSITDGSPAWVALDKPAAFEHISTKWKNFTRTHSRYTFKNKGDVGDITLYGPIGMDFFGDGITSGTFKRDLAALGAVDSIDVRIDSPGGNVSDARAIYNLLVDHKATVNVKIDGTAASAASFIAMAGDNIQIAEGGLFMIHDVRGVARGTASDMRKAAEIIDALTATIADTYQARTGISLKRITDMMTAETWLTGPDAVKLGFADSVIPNKRKSSAASNLVSAYAEAYRNPPSNLQPRRARALALMGK
jgi:ATP-dependent Clp protease protease subunit